MKKYTDWRLPTRQELESIMDLARYNPAIDTDFFPGTKTSAYWSSTTIAGYPNYGAWIVNFSHGYISYGNKCDDYFVRAVRGGQDCWNVIKKHFIDNGDGTVTDTSTGLMWMQKTLDRCTWDEANELAAKLNEEAKE